MSAWQVTEDHTTAICAGCGESGDILAGSLGSLAQRDAGGARFGGLERSVLSRQTLDHHGLAWADLHRRPLRACGWPIGFREFAFAVEMPHGHAAGRPRPAVVHSEMLRAAVSPAAALPNRGVADSNTAPGAAYGPLSLFI